MPDNLPSDRFMRELLADTFMVGSTQPYKVRTGCGHIVIRRMRESTAGVPYTPETIIEAPNGRPCPACEVQS